LTRSSLMTAATSFDPMRRVLNDPGGKAAPFEERVQVQRRLRHVRGILEKVGVARHERRSGEAHHLPQRQVPRRDGKHHAERLPHRPGFRGAHRGGIVEWLVREERLGLAGVEAHAVHALGDLRGGLRDGLAHLQGEQPRQRGGIGLDDVGCGVHPRRPLREAGSGQRGGGPGGLGDPAFDLSRVVRLEGLHSLAGGGIDSCDRHRHRPFSRRR
jgi:hypothetical protein